MTVWAARKKRTNKSDDLWPWGENGEAVLSLPSAYLRGHLFTKLHTFFFSSHMCRLCVCVCGRTYASHAYLLTCVDGPARTTTICVFGALLWVDSYGCVAFCKRYAAGELYLGIWW